MGFYENDHQDDDRWDDERVDSWREGEDFHVNPIQIPFANFIAVLQKEDDPNEVRKPAKVKEQGVKICTMSWPGQKKSITDTLLSLYSEPDYDTWHSIPYYSVKADQDVVNGEESEVFYVNPIAEFVINHH